MIKRMLFALIALCLFNQHSLAKEGNVPLIGLNQNWSYMPELDEAFLSKVAQLKPQILRYPGGTVTHSWDWRKGVINSRAANQVHPLSDIQKLTNTTGAKFVFVLDIVNRTLEDQVEMLQSIQKLGVPIEYIELGNELYAKEDNYAKVLPTGKDYAVKVKKWHSVLKKQFPDAKIAALLFGRSVKDKNYRQSKWNQLVVANTIDFIDAYTYHIYIAETGDFKSTKANFSKVAQAAKTGNKHLWITEYGNKHESDHPNYLQDLNSLADFVESYPNVTLSLNHQIVGTNKNKLSKDGKTITPEGKLFIKRVSK